MPTPLFIGGEWRQGDGPLISTVNPANGEVIDQFPGAGVKNAADAVEAGDAAMRDPAWREMKPHLRARILARIGDAIEREADAISRLQTRDTGKTLTETTALALSAAGTFRYMAATLETLEEEITPSRGDFITMSTWEPMGVIGAITPWNSPIASDAQKIAPALAAGNAVVLKPAEWTPLVSLMLASLCEEAGLPKGLLSVLPGKGSVIGDAIVRHPKVRKVSFTGGTETGRRIAVAAAEKLMPVTLELGGKSPNIVCADADLRQAVAGVLFGIFSSTGQSCIAGSRVFVDAAIHDRFQEMLVDATRALVVGPGDDPATQVAPMVHARHRDSVAQYVDLAREEGGTVLCGGERPTGPVYDKGAYYQPTVLTHLANSSRTAREEIFGPVAVVIPFTSEADLIAQANDSVYGLACGIWTGDYRRAWRLAKAIQAGTVWINTYKQFSISTPFTGVKESGMGIEKGRLALRQYMNQKSLYWGMSDQPLPWARLG